MAHSQIVTKWIGKKYAESKELGNQCVSWAKKYTEESGHPIGGFSGSALKGWQTAIVYWRCSIPDRSLLGIFLP